jgi:anti-sigma B factor antagonist
MVDRPTPVQEHFCMQYQIEMIHSTAHHSDNPNDNYIYKVLLSGNFVMEISEEFSLLISSLIKGGMRFLTFDLTKLSYIDSTGIGIFINLAKQIRANQGDLAFLNVSSKIMEVFKLVKLHDFIPIFKSDKQVIEHLFSLV